jgi:uncharacterized membrane protein
MLWDVFRLLCSIFPSHVPHLASLLPLAAYSLSLLPIAAYSLSLLPLASRLSPPRKEEAAKQRKKKALSEKKRIDELLTQDGEAELQATYEQNAAKKKSRKEK